MTSGKRLDANTIGSVRQLRLAGVPIRQIATRLGISKSAVEDIGRNRTTGPITRSPDAPPMEGTVKELETLRAEVKRLRAIVDESEPDETNEIHPNKTTAGGNGRKKLPNPHKTGLPNKTTQV